MSRILATASAEFRIALRNRWVAIVILVMTLFSLVLSAAGSAPTGEPGVDRPSATVASLTSLGRLPRASRGAPDILRRHRGRGRARQPAARAHLSRVAGRADPGQVHRPPADPRAGRRHRLRRGRLRGGRGRGAGLAALVRLFWTSLLLGATFLGVGYAISAFARRSAAAGLAIVLIVLYDLGLLAGVLASSDGAFSTRVFPWLLLANPADAFRLYNLAASEATTAAAGVGGAAATIPAVQALLSVALWPVLAFAVARFALRRVTP